MLTEKEIRVLHRAQKRYSLKPPSAAEIIKLAEKYKVAAARWRKIYITAPRTKSGGRLDEWDPIYTKWENRLFRAERLANLLKENLLLAARFMRSK